MRSLPQSSGKQDYVSRQVEKNLTEVLLKADAGAQQVFSSREAIAEEQQKLNLLGFYGQNGKPLREDGVLDQDTLLAWNDKTYGGVLLGSNNSPMGQIVAKQGGLSGLTGTYSNIVKGTVPSLTYVNPLPKGMKIIKVTKKSKDFDATDVGITNKELESFTIVDKSPTKLRARGNSVLRLDPPHPIKNLDGKPIDFYHINTLSSKEDIDISSLTKAQQRRYATLKKLNHKPISKTTYDLLHNFDEVADLAKTRGKSLAAVGVALDFAELGMTVYHDLTDEDEKLGKDTVSTAVGMGAAWAGGAAGAKLGAKGGAAIGSFVPGLGTAIGGVIGGIIGGIAGSFGGRKLGEFVVDLSYEGVWERNG